jgi:hypothetical protein
MNLTSFFTSCKLSNSELDEKYKEAQNSLVYNVNSCAIIGEHKAVVNTLFFEHAYGLAKEGKNITYLGLRKTIHSTPPQLNAPLDQLDHNALQRITIKYFPCDLILDILKMCNN